MTILKFIKTSKSCSLVLIVIILLSIHTAPADEIKKKRVKILDSSIAYREGGQGNTVLFIHGTPTSSYLWRNILPEMAESNHVIAIDLIGHGDSGKPFIEYRLKDHVKYLDEFIKSLELENITLVLHDWGSVVGFIYASTHPDNIAGMAFIKAMLGPVSDKSRMPEIALQMRESEGWKMIVNDNFSLENIMPMMSMVPLSKKSIYAYKKPFQETESRRALRMWPLEVPIAGHPEDNYKIFSIYAKYLTASKVPKLLMYSTPGVLIDEKSALLVEQAFENIKVETI